MAILWRKATGYNPCIAAYIEPFPCGKVVSVDPRACSFFFGANYGLINLVGGFNHLEKWWSSSMGRMTSHIYYGIMENKHIWNHQPVNVSSLYAWCMKWRPESNFIHARWCKDVHFIGCYIYIWGMFYHKLSPFKWFHWNYSPTLDKPTSTVLTLWNPFFSWLHGHEFQQKHTNTIQSCRKHHGIPELLVKYHFCTFEFSSMLFFGQFLDLLDSWYISL